MITRGRIARAFRLLPGKVSVTFQSLQSDESFASGSVVSARKRNASDSDSAGTSFAASVELQQFDIVLADLPSEPKPGDKITEGSQGYIVERVSKNALQSIVYLACRPLRT